jgi:hypothetical protein
MTVVFQVFVPVTAAGQRGLFTPLPHIHLFVHSWLTEYNQEGSYLSRIKLSHDQRDVETWVMIVADDNVSENNMGKCIDPPGSL